MNEEFIKKIIDKTPKSEWGKRMIKMMKEKLRNRKVSAQNDNLEDDGIDIDKIPF